MKIGEHNISAEGLLPNSREPDGLALNEPDDKQIELATQWLTKFAKPLKTVRRTRGTSYGLKHRVENWAITEQQDDPYVSNGAFIVAALRLGYVLKRARGSKSGSQNVYFNIAVNPAAMRGVAV